MIIKILEGTEQLVTDKAIGGQLHLELLIHLLLVSSLPVLDIQPLEVCMFGGAIGIDDDQLRKRHYFYSFFLLKHDAEVVVVGAAEGLVLRVDVVAHEHGAEMVANFLEIQLEYVVLLDLEQIAIDLLIDGSYFLQFSQLQPAGILPTG